ncbi:hypothetical protein GQ44DRAFT_699315 [Phaeosphaeriaceae sp. PMI808]|nr:hypothetical protein GQ44DRAFT_699315 [Phaeosphaeriaceae sp. PMI808]
MRLNPYLLAYSQLCALSLRTPLTIAKRYGNYPAQPSPISNPRPLADLSTPKNMIAQRART